MNSIRSGPRRTAGRPGGHIFTSLLLLEVYDLLSWVLCDIFILVINILLLLFLDSLDLFLRGCMIFMLVYLITIRFRHGKSGDYSDYNCDIFLLCFVILLYAHSNLCCMF